MNQLSHAFNLDTSTRNMAFGLLALLTLSVVALQSYTPTTPIVVRSASQISSGNSSTGKQLKVWEGMKYVAYMGKFLKNLGKTSPAPAEGPNRFDYKF